MTEPGKMICETCRKAVSVVRSVRLCGDTNRAAERLNSRFPGGACSDEQFDTYCAAHAAYLDDVAYRRAFICVACYRALDNRYGTGTIVVNGEQKTYALSGECRHDRAAVYDYAKWSRYQKRAAAKMGIDTGA